MFSLQKQKASNADKSPSGSFRDVTPNFHLQSVIFQYWLPNNLTSLVAKQGVNVWRRQKLVPFCPSVFVEFKFNQSMIIIRQCTGYREQESNAQRRKTYAVKSSSSFKPEDLVACLWLGFYCRLFVWKAGRERLNCSWLVVSVTSAKRLQWSHL